MHCARNDSLTDACWHLHYVNCFSTLPRLLRVPPKFNHIVRRFTLSFGNIMLIARQEEDSSELSGAVEEAFMAALLN
jgi:hypothetical protein